MYYDDSVLFTRFIILVVLLFWLLVNGLACNEMIKAAQMKGHYRGEAGILWFIALFAPLGIVAVGLITVSLPDISQRPKQKEAAVEEQLPEI